MKEYKPTKADIRALRFTTETIQGGLACREAKDFVASAGSFSVVAAWKRGGSGSDRSWLNWLGVALVDEGILNQPLFDSKDTGCGVEGCSLCPPLRNVQWYWPLDLLLWGCREYEKRYRNAG